MILKTDFIALMCVSIVCAYLLWFTAKDKTPMYLIIKIISISIGVMWIIMAMLYSQQ
jgi:hypothetical protein